MSTFVSVSADELARRIFRMWDFRVSHSQLLLRSPPPAKGEKNIDIVFVGVDYVDLPTRLASPRLGEPTLAELQHVEARTTKKQDPGHVFVLEAEGRRYLVAAVSMRVFANNLELFESSLERFDQGA